MPTRSAPAPLFQGCWREQPRRRRRPLPHVQRSRLEAKRIHVRPLRRPGGASGMTITLSTPEWTLATIVLVFQIFVLAVLAYDLWRRSNA